MPVYFKSGGKINTNQLEALGNSGEKNINSIKKLLYIPGVLKLPESISKNFLIEVMDSTHINVGYIDSNQADAAFGGVAIDNEGRTIRITENQSYVGSANGNIYFTNQAWTPQRTDDPTLTGFSNNGSTTDGYARNSGNYNIPISAGQMNYVYIRYQEIVKQSAGSSQEANGENYETEFTDGYVIEVSTNELANPDLIYIGVVDATDTSNAPDTYTASNETMQLGYLNGSTVGAPYHAATGTVNYPTNVGEYIDLETHVNALGTGIPSATNPHGLSAADIGANVNNAGFDSVQTITANNTSTTIGEPVLDLSVSNTVAQAYDIVLIDASTAPNNAEVTIRLPEASINTTAYKYTFRATAAASNTTVSITSLINNNTSTNLIDGGTTVQYSGEYYSKLTLNVTEPVTLVVGLTNTGYNWWRV